MAGVENEAERTDNVPGWRFAVVHMLSTAHPQWLERLTGLATRDFGDIPQRPVHQHCDQNKSRQKSGTRSPACLMPGDNSVAIGVHSDGGAGGKPMDTELTMQDLTGDPLIAMMMRADGVEQNELSVLLQSVTHQEVERLQQRLRQARADEFYTRLDHALEARLKAARQRDKMRHRL
jgi:hypothetical protein